MHVLKKRVNLAQLACANHCISRVTRVSMLIRRLNDSTLCRRVIRFIAECGYIWVFDKNEKGGSLADWYGCLKCGCTDASQHNCAGYHKMSTLNFWVGSIAFAGIVLILMF